MAEAVKYLLLQSSTLEVLYLGGGPHISSFECKRWQEPSLGDSRSSHSLSSSPIIIQTNMSTRAGKPSLAEVGSKEGQLYEMRRMRRDIDDQHQVSIMHGC
jgi:hypothetical protein